MNHPGKERHLAVNRRPSITKRQKERRRQERKQRKQERLEQNRAQKEEAPVVAPGEDPDLAGIVPGPQPLPWED